MKYYCYCHKMSIITLILQCCLNHDYRAVIVNVISQKTVMLMGLDISLGGGFGPFSPSSNTASHLISAPLCVLFRWTLRVCDTFIGDRVTLRSQSMLFQGKQPLTCIVSDAGKGFWRKNKARKGQKKVNCV